jgi:membrane-bound lytic murein transglycosylase D
MNYYKKYNIVPQSSNLSVMKTDTVLVNKFISLNSVARVLNISLAQLTQLNPSYKVMIVNGSPSAPKTLVIPQSAKEKYTTLYNSINADLGYIQLDKNMLKYATDKAAETELNSYYRSKKRSRRNPNRQYFSYSVNHKAQQISID